MAKTARRQQGEGSLYRRADGLWVGAVVLGYKPDGTPRRKTVSSKEYKTAQRKLTDLKAEAVRTGGAIPTASMTVEKWCAQWLANSRVKPGTMLVNRTTVRQYIVPAIGKRRLDRLTPQHIYELHHHVEDRGLAPSTLLRVHRSIVKILKDAMREGLVTRNVADLVDAPSKGVTDQTVLSAEQAKTLLRSRTDDRLMTRWAAALLLGARQGEVLGMTWDRVDLERGILDLSWQLQRLPYRHGCRGGCGVNRPGSCPQRELDVRPGFEYRRLEGGLCLTRPKSTKSTRLIPLPAPFVGLLLVHRTAQAGEANPHRLVFTRPNGRPLDPSLDNAAWHDALEVAGLPSIKLHAARHSTATLLMELKVPDKVIGAILGHSTVAVTQAYQHVDLALARDAMDRLGVMLALED